VTIPFFSLQRLHQSIQGELDEAISEVIRKGTFVLGEEVESFEHQYAAYTGTKYCISVASGLDALIVSLRAVGIGKGDEVLVPSHTCQATWLAVTLVGATPIPVEVTDLLIDPSKILSHLTKKAKAILPVHLYGQPCNMDLIGELAKKNNLLIVEDNAQAHGATWKSIRTGSFGIINATSFYPTKNLGALGDGGAITTNDKELATFAKKYRNYGSEEKGCLTIVGINSRLDEMQAALLRVKLNHLSKWNLMRTQTAELYYKNLQGVGDVILPPQKSTEQDWTHVYHQFVIRTKHRDSLKKFLNDKGIETAIHYPTPIHLQQAYQFLNLEKESLPGAERLSETVLSLPIWPGLLPEEAEFISQKVTDFFYHL